MKLTDVDLKMFLPNPPFWMVAFALLFVLGTWVPLTLMLRARQTLSEKPRVHIFHDMDHQAKYHAQDWTPIFADGRAMRPPVPGTVVAGQPLLDDHLQRGYRAGEEGKAAYFDTIPSSLTVDEKFLLRGKKEFDTFCYPCHGKAGYGDGPVNARALEIKDSGWIVPANLHTTLFDTGGLQFGPSSYPDGELYNTITHGKGNMAGYAPQIPDPADRWAIVAYVRALQLSQNPEAYQPSAVSREPANTPSASN